MISTGTYNQNIHVYDVNTYQYVKALVGHIGTVTSLVPATTGKLLFSASYDTTVQVHSYQECSQQRHDVNDDGVRRSEKQIDQWNSGKLSTGSAVKAFLRTFTFSFDFALSLLNLPDMSKMICEYALIVLRVIKFMLKQRIFMQFASSVSVPSYRSCISQGQCLIRKLDMRQICALKNDVCFFNFFYYHLLRTKVKFHRKVYV